MNEWKKEDGGGVAEKKTKQSEIFEQNRANSKLILLVRLFFSPKLIIDSPAFRRLPRILWRKFSNSANIGTK